MSDSSDLLLFLILVCQILMLVELRKLRRSKDFSKEDAVVQEGLSDIIDARKRVPPQH